MKFRYLSYLLVLAVLLFYTFDVIAKEAVPMAKDPEMEKRVNAIASELRCLVCQNQTIADSHAELAVDLKNQVRQMVSDGKTQDDIVAYMVQRYGDFVRYRPPMEASTFLLWVGPFLLMVLGIIILFTSLRKRREVVVEAPLSAEESSRFDAIIQEQSKHVTEAVKDKRS